MSLFKKRELSGITARDLIPARGGSRRGSVAVTNDSAMRVSAVWACLRLRANLISTFPVDVFRRVDGKQVEVPKPPVLVSPGGDQVGYLEWAYSTQVDLDRAGNAVGIITARDGGGLPARIELVPLGEVSIKVKGGRLHKYRIGGDSFDPVNVWHEKQYTLPGLHVGLSPVAYAAWALGEYMSIQQFALDWFGNGAIPAAHLRNTKQLVDTAKATEVKERFKANVSDGDVFVSGMDWEYKPIQAEVQGNAWIEAKQLGISDIARFFDCPGDLIDAAVSGQAVTYANLTQRNLQLLIMHLAPAIIRREDAFSRRLVSSPRYVKMNTDALLRMDPKTRAETLKVQIDSRTLTPSEARELENRPPLTEGQLAEFDRVFGAARTTPIAAPSGATP